MAYKKTVWVEGETPLSPRNLNNIEEGIEAQEAALEAHKADYASHKLVGNVTEILYRNTEGYLTRVDESVGGLLCRRRTLSYAGGNLTTINTKLYASDGLTVEKEWTDAMYYSNGMVDKVIRTML